MRPSCTRAIGCLTVVLLLAGATGYWGWQRLTWRPPVPPLPSPMRVQEARRQSKALAQKIKVLAPPPRAQRPRRGPTSKPDAHGPSPNRAQAEPVFTLTLKQDELNASLQPGSDAAASLEAAGLRSPTLELGENRVTLRTYVRQGDTDLYVTLQGIPVVNRAGKPRFRIQDVRVGLLPAPAPLRRYLQSQMESALRQIDAQMSVRLDRITVREGALVLHGRRAAGDRPR